MRYVDSKLHNVLADVHGTRDTGTELRYEAVWEYARITADREGRGIDPPEPTEAEWQEIRNRAVPGVNRWNW